MEKSYRLTKDEIRPLIRNYGGCIATDTITIDGYPVRFMYREDPDNPLDSGWRFLSGFESDDYMEDPENSGIFDVNTIANYDPKHHTTARFPCWQRFREDRRAGTFRRRYRLAARRG